MIGSTIRATRDRRAMTQQELAEAAGFPQTTISRIERGVVKPRASTVRKIAKALRVTVEALTVGEARR